MDIAGQNGSSDEKQGNGRRPDADLHRKGYDGEKDNIGDDYAFADNGRRRRVLDESG